jgi:HEAT repeat protein
MEAETMPGDQLDLFAGSGRPDPRDSCGPPAPPAVDWGALDDEHLIAAIHDAGLVDAPAVIAEVSARNLVGAIPALAELCRRFSGFGIERNVPEQSAALDALAAIGGPEAAQAVAGLIAGRAIQGPALRKAVDAAARLGAKLPPEAVLELLRHDDPKIRADACRCARLWPSAVPLLRDLLDDLHRDVCVAAACALGRLGQTVALPLLTRLLRDHPSAEIIKAVVPVADEACIVLLGRVARLAPDQADIALDALDAIDDPRAEAIARSVRGAEPAQVCPREITDASS